MERLTREQRLELYKRAVDKWGFNSQIDQLIEEMAELTLALCKYKRLKTDVAPNKEKIVMDNLLEELADVKMCMEQSCWLFGDEKVLDVLDKKFEKFLGQLNS